MMPFSKRIFSRPSRIVTLILLPAVALVAAPPLPGQMLPVTTSSEMARAQFEAGREDAFHWQAAKAREHLDAALAADSAFVLAHLHRAGTSARSESMHSYFERAEAHGADVSEDEQRLMDAFRAFLIDHEYDLAIQILEELSEEYPDDPYLPGYLGMRYYNHYQDYDEASRHFQEALDRDSTFVPAYHLLGAAALNQQDYSAAEAYFREGVRLAPDEWRPYYALGLLFARQGAWAQASGYFERAFERDRTDGVRNRVGYLYLQAGRNEEAERVFRENIRLHPDEPNTYDSLGELYLAMDRFDEAAEQFGQALALDSDLTVSRDNLVRARIEQMNLRFEKAFGEQDAAAVAALYTDTGQLLPAGSEIVDGTDSIRRYWEKALRIGLTDASLETREVYVGTGGETATEVGRYRLTLDEDVVDEGKYVVVWQRTRDGWKIHRDIWTTSRPSDE